MISKECFCRYVQILINNMKYIDDIAKASKQSISIDNGFLHDAYIDLLLDNYTKNKDDTVEFFCWWLYESYNYGKTAYYDYKSGVTRIIRINTLEELYDYLLELEENPDNDN